MLFLTVVGLVLSLQLWHAYYRRGAPKQVLHASSWITLSGMAGIFLFAFINNIGLIHQAPYWWQYGSAICIAWTDFGLLKSWLTIIGQTSE
jgi:hypothetical protein